MTDPIIKVNNLKKYFDLGGGLLSLVGGQKSSVVKAVDDVSFEIYEGKILGLAGESGSGKTTTGMSSVLLHKPTSGKIIFENKNILDFNKIDLKYFRRSAQMIFQDPYESLNPRFNIFQSIEEPLIIHGYKNKIKRNDLVHWALEQSELRPAHEYFEKYPHQLSGGQRQRVSIARAIVLKPKFLVADEPVSMLDVSIRAGLLKLFKTLTKNLQMAGLFISHDLSLIRHICDDTAIMYLGKIIEIGNTENIITKPIHPYSKALLSGVSVPDPKFKRKRIELTGEIPSAKNIPKGCRFHTRCFMSNKKCETIEPDLLQNINGVSVACLEV